MFWFAFMWNNKCHLFRRPFLNYPNKVEKNPKFSFLQTATSLFWWTKTIIIDDNVFTSPASESASHS